MASMKTVVLTGIRKMELINSEIPVIQNETDVLIRITSIGVCGSDVHYFTDGKIGSQVVEYPFAVGHECSGIVEETGSAVTHLKKGDLVAVDPSIHCGECDQCLAGRPHTCRKTRFLGCPGQIEGCLSEYIVMPEFTCFPLEDSFSALKAALIEPLSIGVYSVELAHMNLNGKAIGIFGAGPIGLSVLMSLKKQYINRVVCIEPLEYRLQKAVDLGADYIINPGKEIVDEEVSVFFPEMLDVVFECSGEQDAVDNAVYSLKPGGKLVLVGIPPEAVYTFNMDLMRRKELSVQNVRRQNHCVEKAIELVRQGLPVEKMVTHHFKLEESQIAFDLVSNYEDGVIKAMIDFRGK